MLIAGYLIIGKNYDVIDGWLRSSAIVALTITGGWAYQKFFWKKDGHDQR